MPAQVFIYFPLLFFLCMFAPGFLVVRRSGLDPVEKVVCSIGLSIFLIYLTSFCIYLSGLPAISYFGVTFVCAVIFWICRRDLVDLFRVREIRTLFCAFAGLYLWTVSLLASVRNYSGGDWYGDWFEHYHRTLFFLNRLRIETLFLNLYLLPARPPLFNLVSAHFLAQAGQSFAVFQLTAMLLNLVVFFAAYLFFRKLAPAGRASPLLLALLVACNPLIVQNATYPWTKLLAAFYTLVGVWFFWQSFSRSGALFRHLAFFSLSIGLLTHYSTGPYLLLIAVFYLLTAIIRKRFEWREIAPIAGVNLLVLLTWFAWSFMEFGFRTTFLANISVDESSRLSISQNAQKVAANIRDTVIPHFLRSSQLSWFPSDNRWFSLREYFFWMYQENLLLALGIAGWLAAAMHLWRIAGRAWIRNKLELYAWTVLILGAIGLGIAVHGGRATGGLTNICLQPLVASGIALIAAGYAQMSRGFRGLLLAGMAFDVCVGILLHFFYQRQISPSTHASRQNWALKTQEHLIFLSDASVNFQFIVSAAVLLTFVCWALVSRYIKLRSTKPSIGPHMITPTIR